MTVMRAGDATACCHFHWGKACFLNIVIVYVQWVDNLR